MLKPKVGDLVRLKPMKVLSIGEDDSVYLQDEFSWNRHEAYNNIEEILPRPLAVGDRVRVGAGNNPGEIVGLHGAWAWVFFKSGGFESYEIRRLTRIDEP